MKTYQVTSTILYITLLQTTVKGIQLEFLRGINKNQVTMLNVWYRKASALKFEKYKCIAFSQNIKPCALKFFKHRNALHTVQLICEGNHGENLVYLCVFFSSFGAHLSSSVWFCDQSGSCIDNLKLLIFLFPLPGGKIGAGFIWFIYSSCA